MIRRNVAAGGRRHPLEVLTRAARLRLVVRLEIEEVPQRKPRDVGVGQRHVDVTGEHLHLVAGGPGRHRRVLAPLEDAFRARLADDKGRVRVVGAHPRGLLRPEGGGLFRLVAVVVPCGVVVE
eukprot:scaffold90946_cov61-Phaeocystis_antarctica.AAC.4